MPKGACSSRVSRAVNGAMVEVSGKTEHSGLAGFAWAQSSDVFNFDGRRRVTDREPLRVALDSRWRFCCWFDMIQSGCFYLFLISG